MTTETRDTRIIVDPDVPLVRIVREFEAPPARVFAAHADPELLKRWLGPHELTMEVDHYDCRSGGSWRYSHHDGDGTYRFFGSFHEVRPDELIVQTFAFEGFPDSVALERLELVELPGGRCRLTGTSLVDSFDGRDAFVASGMEVGVREGYEKLDSLLAG